MLSNVHQTNLFLLSLMLGTLFEMQLSFILYSELYSHVQLISLPALVSGGCTITTIFSAYIPILYVLVGNSWI